MHEAVLVDAIRTPVGRGRPGGALAGVHPVRLLSGLLQSLVTRNDLDPDLVEDVLVGCVNQVREQSSNVGRTAVLAAGLPDHVPATMIERQCGSSQQAAAFAAQAVMSGFHDVVIAAGVESMSTVPMGSARGDADNRGPDLARRYPEGLVNQGVSAELIAVKWSLGRQDQDAFALRSHQLAAAARDDGSFAAEIVSVDNGGTSVAADEGIRDTSLDALAKLRPSFADESSGRRFPEITWSVTAGNSSQISDGAAAALIMSRRRADHLGLRPRAVFRSFAVTGDDPLYKLTGIIPATEKVLARSGLRLADIDVFEINEAFASVVLAWERHFSAGMDRVNVHGGAIALGHPLGASGGRLLATLLHALDERGGRYGLQLMCEGGGMANATLIERLP